MQPGSIEMKYRGAHDVYRELVDESDESWLLGLLAFAVVEEQRIEWLRHQEKINGVLPSADEIDHWYLQQSPGVLLRAKGTAENALRNYSEEVVAEIDNEYVKEVERSIIVREIRDSKRFWPQFAINMTAGFASALLFALLLVAFAVIATNDLSILDFTRK
jgi:hypothetical protein